MKSLFFLVLIVPFFIQSQSSLYQNEQIIAELILEGNNCKHEKSPLTINVRDSLNHLYLSAEIDSITKKIKRIKFNFNNDLSLYEEKIFETQYQKDSSTLIYQVKYSNPYHVDGNKYSNNKILIKEEKIFSNNRIESIQYYFFSNDKESIIFEYDDCKLIKFKIYINDKLWDVFYIDYL